MTINEQIQNECKRKCVPEILDAKTPEVSFQFSNLVFQFTAAVLHNATVLNWRSEATT